MHLALTGFVFQETGQRHALEDRFLCDWNARVLAVADGVTRSAYAPNPAEESWRVGEVAREYCRTALEMIPGKPTAETARAMLVVGEEGNRRIAALNATYGCAAEADHAFCDPYGAVGACGVLDQQDVWHFGFIGDSGLMLFGIDGKRSLLTQDQLAGTRRVLDSLAHLPAGERLEFLRKHLRNQSQARDANGQLCGYGVFNGHPNALAWWKTGTAVVQPGDVLVAFTDGAQPFIAQAEFEGVVRTLRGPGGADAALATCRALWSGWIVRPECDGDDATLVAARVDSGA